MIIRIGTRGSNLAVTQSRWVKQEIEARYPQVEAQLIKIKTTGDKILDSPLSKIGGKGLFVKEIEEALLRKQVDVAVHSMKDVPAELAEALMLSSYPEREDPRDAIISSGHLGLEGLPHGSRVGTSSLRRAAQLLFMRPDLDLLPLRGNVDTRLRKVKSGDFLAIILATAGLRRLRLEHHISQIIPSQQILPAIGQGALGLEVRQDDEQTINLLRFLNHVPTEKAVKAERAFMKELGGGCQVPIAALGHLDGDILLLEGMVAEVDGSRLIRDKVIGGIDDSQEIGTMLARKLLESGADRILEKI